MRSFCRNPMQVGSIAPSSPALCRQMASMVRLDSACVLEIGAGTGPLTLALLEHGIAPERLWVVEIDPRLADHLQRKFPRVHVLCGDALRLSELLPADMPKEISSAVSSLPLRNMSEPDRRRAVSGVLDRLQMHGQLLQFTYGLTCPVHTKRLPMTAERVGWVWNNCPPAAIWRYRKVAERKQHSEPRVLTGQVAG